MNERNFSGTDLNLLVVFAVVMRERSTTRAGNRLFLSQSAVSHALRRLRTLFEDDLFVRASQGVAPTPRAEALYRDLLPCLQEIERKLRERDAFDPAISDRTFRMGLPSSLDVCVTPLLLDRLAVVAPAVNLVIRPVDLHTGPRMIDDEEIDLGVSSFPQMESWHPRADHAEGVPVTPPHTHVVCGRSDRRGRHGPGGARVGAARARGHGRLFVRSLLPLGGQRAGDVADLRGLRLCRPTGSDPQPAAVRRAGFHAVHDLACAP